MDYRKRNVIWVENESIIINNEIEKPFDSLETILENHILNSEEKSGYSSNVEKAIIFYYPDSMTSTKIIKNQLTKISSQFNALKKKWR